MTEYDRAWRWRTAANPWHLPGLALGAPAYLAQARIPHPLAHRAYQPCRVLARGPMNSVLVEFEDGHRTVTSRWATRPRTPLTDRHARPPAQLALGAAP